MDEGTENRHHELIEGLDAIIWEADARTFRFTFVSRQAERLLGYPVEAWLSEPDFWVRHIHPDDRDRAVRFCQTATEEGRDHSFDYRLMAADGREVWFYDTVRVVADAAGRPTRLQGLMVDITERKRLEEALRDREARLHILLHQMPAVLWTTDAQLRFTSSVGAGLKELGLRPGQVVGMSLQEFFGSDAAGELPLAAHLAALRRQAGHYEQEWSGRHFHVHLEPLLGADGTVTGTIGVATDITELKHAEASLGRARDDLLVAERERKQFYREIIRSVTHGKLHLLDEIPPPEGASVMLDVSLVDQPAYSQVRTRLRELAGDAGMDAEAAEDMVLATGEAVANAIKHGVDGRCALFLSDSEIFARVSDSGTGIRPEDIPASVLLPGYSTAVSLGMGYTLMLKLVDEVLLATGPGGTTVQLRKRLQSQGPSDYESELLERFR